MNWKPIETAPKDGSEFIALIGGLPYKARYDEIGRFIWYMHINRATGGSYLVHKIDGKRLLEEIKAKEYDYQPSGCFWKRGMEDKPTHWMPLPPPPVPQTSTHSNESGGKRPRED